MDQEEVDQMLDGIKKIAECPVCLEVVQPPVAQCANGHISCMECREPLEECPVCRGPFIATINRIVGQFLDFLPKPCPYSDKGCKAVTLLVNHTQYCEFRPITCLVGSDEHCNWSGTVREWKAHVINHSDMFCSFTKFNELQRLVFFKFNCNWNFGCYYHKIVEEYFLFYVWKKGNTFCQTLKHVQCKKPEHEYYYKVKFVSVDGNLFYKSLIQSTPLKGNESLESEPAIFLRKELNHITDKNGTLTISIEPLQEKLYEQVEEGSEN